MSGPGDPKTPSFSGSGDVLPHNAASAAMAQVGGWQKVSSFYIREGQGTVRTVNLAGFPTKRYWLRRP